MKALANKLSFVTQNVLLGTVTGTMVAYNLKVFFQRVGGTDLVWVLFLLMGPAVGYLSGKERQRLEKLKKEKTELKENMDKIQESLAKSRKKYRLLVEHANDAIYLTTEGGRFILMNEATSLLSGYRKEQLLKMNISQLKMEDHVEEETKQSWLDNGFCRYEEKWKNQNGETVPLEINARWIRLGEHQLILHVARNVIRKKELDQEDRTRRIRKFQENKLFEIASVHRALQNRILTPVSDTMTLLEHMSRAVPGEATKIQSVMNEWTKTRRMLEILVSKNYRDLQTAPARWNINDVIRQEIIYLETVFELGGIAWQTTFADNVEDVFGFGRDFSIAFGMVLRAVLESMKKMDRKEFILNTRPMDDQILMEVQAYSEDAFRESLSRIVNPYHEEGKSKVVDLQLGYHVCQSLFESFGGSLDIGDQMDKGFLIRIRVPTVGEDAEAKKKSLKEAEEKSLII